MRGCMRRTQGNGQLIQLLRAYLKRLLLAGADLQRFLRINWQWGLRQRHIYSISPSFSRSRNTAVTTLEQLEKNRFRRQPQFTGKNYCSSLTRTSMVARYPLSKPSRVVTQSATRKRTCSSVKRSHLPAW
jgi:hypothetical protein